MSTSDASSSFLGGPWFRALIVFGAIGALSVLFALLDLDPDLSHVRLGVLSGSPAGNYHAVVERMAEEAAEEGGAVVNLVSQGSLDNLERLVAAQEGCEASFALAQDGLPWPEEGVELIARLPSSESVLFLGREAASVRVVAELEGKRIGVGPEGSGTALLAAQLFASRGFRNLHVDLVHLPVQEQMAQLVRGELDLGMFVIAPGAEFVDRAIRERGLEIASFEHARSIAERLPLVRSEVMPAGYYDPFLVLPPEPRHVLAVDTLVLGNGCASRTQTMGLLTLLQAVFPDLVLHNRTTPNRTGLTQNEAADRYFENGGPELLDRYVPWLANIMPLANLVQLGLVISVGMNLMTLGHQFRLWRIDTLRVGLEKRTRELVGTSVPELVKGLTPSDYTAHGLAPLDGLIEGFRTLRGQIRRHAVSWLVPMGQEIIYRHQENLVEERLIALQGLRERLVAAASEASPEA